MTEPEPTLVIQGGAIVAVASATHVRLTAAATAGVHRRRALLMGLFAMQINSGRRPGPYTEQAAAAFADAAEQLLQPR